MPPADAQTHPAPQPLAPPGCRLAARTTWTRRDPDPLCAHPPLSPLALRNVSLSDSCAIPKLPTPRAHAPQDLPKHLLDKEMQISTGMPKGPRGPEAAAQGRGEAQRGQPRAPRPAGEVGRVRHQATSPATDHWPASPHCFPHHRTPAANPTFPITHYLPGLQSRALLSRWSERDVAPAISPSPGHLVFRQPHFLPR